MSWIYGILRSGQGARGMPQPELVHSKSLLVINTPRLYIAAGGISETCFYSEEENEQAGWAVVGLGIKVTGTTSRLLGKADWHGLLTGNTPWRDSLDGHFAAIRWDGEVVECFTDDLGLRTLYFSKGDGGTCISTRLDWVTRTTGHAEIDFLSLGSKWLMFNQLECEACVVSVDRLGPRGYVLFKHGELVKLETTPWLPEFGEGEIVEAATILSSLLRGAFDDGRAVSLGLSGGLDSRLLLAMLMRIENRRLGVHTFGDAWDPDVRMSAAIADTLGIERKHFDEPLSDVSTRNSMCREFIAQSCLAEPATSFLKLRYYPALRQQGRLMIDGGFGEIARRQYLNRVATLGRSALRRSDTKKLFSLMRVERGDIFNPDVVELMKRGAHESLERVLSSLPPVSKVGVENSLDLLAIRTRVPNYGAPEQARIDADVINFMPLVQPSFLRAVFVGRTGLRNNGRFYRNLIRASCLPLAGFPLVKSGMTYGFGLSTPAAWLLTKLKSEFNKAFVDPAPDRFLMHSREHITDLAHSSGVAEWSPYDNTKIRNAVDGYFRGGKRDLRNTVDWWMTFELWRKSLSGTE